VNSFSMINNAGVPSAGTSSTTDLGLQPHPSELLALPVKRRKRQQRQLGQVTLVEAGQTPNSSGRAVRDLTGEGPCHDPHTLARGARHGRSLGICWVQHPRRHRR
jgi:hypothetical protein